MERKERKDPTPAEVLSKWELSDIVEQTSAVGPVDAFKLFMKYAEQALDHRFERELYRALHFDACYTGEIQPNKDQHYIASAETRERFTNTVNTALRDRIAPLLPAIRAYVGRRPNDPATISWLNRMADQIERIPGALIGCQFIRTAAEPDGYLRPRKFEPMAWKELHDGLLEILNTPLPTNAAPATTEDTATAALALPSIPWTGTVQVLAWLLRELAEKGWIEAPRHRSTTSRYSAGDINAKRYAEVMAPHFGVNLTTLERELKPGGGTVPAQDVEEFRIPKRPE